MSCNKNIPIRNIYYMLCYAWNRLKEMDIKEIDQLDFKNIWDLLSRVLSTSLGQLIKKGLYRDYIPIYEDTSTIKGKINFNDCIKKNTFINAKAYCQYDEFSYDTIHNQIIKATIYNLLRSKDVSQENKNGLFSIYNYFSSISDISLNKKIFRFPRIYRNNLYYGFLLNICELIFDNLLVDEITGKKYFKDFLQDDSEMAYLFENFVRNFYKKNLPDYKVFREDIHWDAQGNNLEMLPKMQTDISLLGKDRKIIMDTKYYGNVLTNNMGSEKLISSNLYQLFAYLKNNESKSSIDMNSKGIILYPESNKGLDLEYEIGGHKIKVCTLNLNEEWQDVHDRLLEIVA